MTTQQALTIYSKYVEAWNPISAEQRKSILEEVFEPRMEYLVPAFDGSTPEVIQDIERFQKQYPGAHFEVENVSTHHAVALFKWVLVLPDGKVTVKGHDAVRFSPNSKITSILTFGPGTPRP